MLGESMALGAALVWSISLILFRQSESVSPLGLNLFKNTLGLGLILVTLVVLREPVAWDRPAADWWMLGVSGVLGIGIADTLVFMALRRLGPGLLAIVDCVYAPVIVLFSVAFLGERVGASFLAGAALVVGGVLLGTLPGAGPVLPAADRRTIAAGVALGVSGIVSMALGVMLSKRALERSGLLDVTAVRLVAGTASQFVWIALVPKDRVALAAFRPGRGWVKLVPAAILSAYVSMLLWMGGFKWASASSAAVLNQMSTVSTMVLARVVLGERLTRRRAFGGAMAISGAVLVLRARG